jgi:hypothetical protein
MTNHALGGEFVNVLVTGYSEGKKIHAIKGIHSASGIGLKEAKAIADEVDMGREPELKLTSPAHAATLDEMGVRYRAVEVDVPLKDFLALLGDYPREITVGDLYAVLSVAEAHSRKSTTP